MPRGRDRSRAIRKDHPHTPDGRYFVARGELRRCTNPALDDSARRRLIKTLMQARMAERRADSEAAYAQARADIQAAKVALGEAGPVWWDDGAEDFSGLAPEATPYADWWRSLGEADA